MSRQIRRALYALVVLGAMLVPASASTAQIPTEPFERSPFAVVAGAPKVVVRGNTILTYGRGYDAWIYQPDAAGEYHGINFAGEEDDDWLGYSAAWWNGGFVVTPGFNSPEFLHHFVEIAPGEFARETIERSEIAGFEESGLNPFLSSLAVWGDDLVLADHTSEAIHVLALEDSGYRITERYLLSDFAVDPGGSFSTVTAAGDGDTLVVGWTYWFENSRPAPSWYWGRAVVMQRNPQTGTVTSTVLRDQDQPINHKSITNLFGWDVAIEGATVVVSNPYGQNYEGGVHVFDFSAGNEYDEIVLRYGNARFKDFLGEHLSINGRYIAASTSQFVRLPELPPRDGALVIFERVGPMEYREHVLKAESPEISDGFGQQVGGSDGIFITGRNVVSESGFSSDTELTILHRGRCREDFVTTDLASGDLPTSERDIIAGTPGSDVIAAGGGDDVVCSGAGDDVVFGQAGADTIYGDDGNDKLRGGDGPDILLGGPGADDLAGGRGDDNVQGQDGADSAVRGGTGDDLVGGGAGDDLIVGGNGGEDDVSGGPGNDKVTGGPRPDVLSGGFGDDEVKGNGGGDTLMGNAGDDSLFGGPGGDTLDGGDGSDVCNGGTTPGADPANELDTDIRCETSVNTP